MGDPRDLFFPAEILQVQNRPLFTSAWLRSRFMMGPRNPFSVLAPDDLSFRVLPCSGRKPCKILTSYIVSLLTHWLPLNINLSPDCLILRHEVTNPREPCTKSDLRLDLISCIYLLDLKGGRTHENLVFQSNFLTQKCVLFFTRR